MSFQTLNFLEFIDENDDFLENSCNPRENWLSRIYPELNLYSKIKHCASEQKLLIKNMGRQLKAAFFSSVDITLCNAVSRSILGHFHRNKVLPLFRLSYLIQCASQSLPLNRRKRQVD